jgi:hypothetical protein
VDGLTHSDFAQRLIEKTTDELVSERTAVASLLN